MDQPTSEQMTPIPASPEPIASQVPSVASSIAGFFLIFVLSACSLFGSTDADRAPDLGTRAERIQALRQAIAADHADLEDLITLPREDGTPDPHLDPELRTIANRLGENERELARLQALALEDAR
jgi:hypothetical protein